jgi:hypothetical protein
MPEMNPKTLALIGGLVLIIVLCVVVIGRLATAPRETINDFHKIPPKGAGRFDRN